MKKQLPPIDDSRIVEKNGERYFSVTKFDSSKIGLIFACCKESGLKGFAETKGDTFELYARCDMYGGKEYEDFWETMGEIAAYQVKNEAQN